MQRKETMQTIQNHIIFQPRLFQKVQSKAIKMLFKSVERERERRERLTAGLRLKDITKLSEHNRKGGRIHKK